MDLKQLRDGIDEIDSGILSLFLKRMELCRNVADYKREHKMPPCSFMLRAKIAS